ncbi:MAG: hypothetical protein RL217_1908 [Pseudomonadota bacterium]|jgi:Ser/Thr protein kinase RdoA (MazF antagonist)
MPQLSAHPYDSLSQDCVLDAVEKLGFYSDGRVFPLNSYENRVYQVGIEGEQPIIAKFYRPKRWSAPCIQEELNFLLELQEEDVPVVAPLEHQGSTLHEHQGFYFALFPRRGGHAPELGSHHHLELLGRMLARLHQCGAQQSFKHRPKMQGAEDFIAAQEQLLASGLLPPEYRAAYQSLIKELSRLALARWGSPKTLRLHGDLHLGNLLLRDDNLYVVDFDDCLQGPAMQDIWMLLSGQVQEQRRELEIIAQGYELFRPFPWHETPLIELLRTLRMVRYAAWLALRWQDPAFPEAFPWFASARFWSEHLQTLREQVAVLQEQDY